MSRCKYLIQSTNIPFPDGRIHTAYACLNKKCDKFMKYSMDKASVCSNCLLHEKFDKEKENENMSNKIEVVTTKEVTLEEYWCIRGIKDTGKKKEVVAELDLTFEPNEKTIAQFLIQYPEADFCSVEHNYALLKEG